MLQAIRDRAQGWIAWVIIGIIILVFALFGIEQYAQGDKSVDVAEVNGESIGSGEFLTLYNAQKQRLQQQFGDMYDTVVKDEDLRNQVLDALIESKLIEQWADSQKMVISDPQLAAAIQSAPVFQEEGKFSDKVYKEILSRNGFSVARFEHEQRQFLLENQFNNLLMSSSFATDAEVSQLAELQAQQREINYIRVDQRPFMDQVTVSEQQVAEYFEAHKADYIESEKVKVDYIDLSQQQIAKNIAVTDDAIEAFYNQNKSLFTTPEKRQASHILIRTQEGEESEQKALEKINEIKTKLDAGEDFAELAKTYSEDPGSALSGGELGSFEQGMMVPEFDQAVFSMQVGTISEPIKTEFGYHLIKLEKVQPQSVKPLADIRDQVVAEYRNQEAEKQYYDLLDKMNTMVYEQPDTLQPAAEALGLKVQSSEFFGRHGGVDELTSNPKVSQAAFSNDVLKSKLNSTAIELGNNRAVVLRVNTYQEERQKALSEVADEIKQQLVREAAVAESSKLADSLLTKVQQGESPESLMNNGIEWHTVGWVGRDSKNILPQMLAEVFKIKKPQNGESVWHKYQLQTGDSVLIQLKGVKSQELTAQQRDNLKNAYLELNGNAELAARLNALKASADIEKLKVYQTLK
ncbi:SurA N-terminal domain-containing protein [Thiomicrorhabdus sp. 6S3-12]|uniref:SurA N-terminal domain-containing protein n=1 Tax=Thiomicrorhabdus sp. 6S3-12 TaxID=2819681 RepID=UPI001AAD98C3|nr:SurA N-terminal domain-containing protein [Thiomicrorhabdus sp. 6S3-12]MBO1924039.1 SurA N-terminal domain-containing protein [Thiomicrorhabdus sp. 6S3-12]